MGDNGLDAVKQWRAARPRSSEGGCAFELLPRQPVDEGEMHFLAWWPHQGLESSDDPAVFDAHRTNGASTVGVVVGGLEVEGDEAANGTPVGGHRRAQQLNRSGR